MSPALRQRATLPALGFSAVEPAVRRFGYGLAFGGGSVDALGNVHPNLIVAGVGVLLALKCLDVAIAVLIGVVNDPGFLWLALAGRPFALAYRHDALPR